MRDQLFRGSVADPGEPFDEFRVELGSNEHFGNVPAYVHVKATMLADGRQVCEAINNVYCYCNNPGSTAMVKHAFVVVNFMRKMPRYPEKATFVFHDLAAYLVVTKQRHPMSRREYDAVSRLYKAIKGYEVPTEIELGDGSLQKPLEAYIEDIVRKTTRIQPHYETLGTRAETHYNRIRHHRLEGIKTWTSPK